MGKIIDNTQKNLIYLLACSLENVSPKLKYLKDLDTKRLYRYSHIHSIASIIGSALAKSDNLSLFFNEEEIKYWQMSVNNALKKRIQFDMERKEITSFLDKAGIWYCPLKGIIIQDLYPSFEMREMADNDLLYDSGKRDLLMEYMNKRGYEIEFSGVTNHDEYIKPPIFNFEFHSKLFRSIFSEKFTDYYDHINDKLIEDGNDSFGRHMSREDFYIYFVAHAYKHYKRGGTGLRTLSDFYVINKAYRDNFNWNYTKNELQKLGIAGFEGINRRIAKKIFSKPEDVFPSIDTLSEKELRLLTYMANSGTYGQEEDEIKGRLKEGRLAFVISRLFPNEAYYREAHPFIYKHPYLKIFFLPYRWSSRLILNRRRILKEIKILLK